MIEPILPRNELWLKKFRRREYNKKVILDEPTVALVKEGNMVLELIRRVRNKGLAVVLISHNMPHVFEIADCIHVARLGRRRRFESEEDCNERCGRRNDRRDGSGTHPGGMAGMISESPLNVGIIRGTCDRRRITS